MARKKRNTGKKKNSVKGSGKNLIKTLKDEKTRKVIGLSLILFSVFLLVAVISYFFNWKGDYSHSSWNYLFNSSIEVPGNSLGRLGAILAHQLVFKWFGISSLIIVGLCFATGANLIFKKRIFHLERTYRYGIFFMILGATLFSFIFLTIAGSGFPWGGEFGAAINDWLNGFAGKAGTGLLLGFTILIYLVISLNIDFNMDFLHLFRKTKPEPAMEGVGEGVGIYDGDTSSEDAMRPEKIEDAIEEPVAVVEPEPEPVIEEHKVIDLNLEEEKAAKEATKTKKKAPEGDLTLEVAEKKEIQETKDVKNISNNYDPTLDLSNYKYPGLNLLEEHGSGNVQVDKQELEKNKDQIIETLSNYKIQISKIKATIGPTVTLYEIVPAPGVRISKIKNLEDDIALSLSALGIRIIAPIPGKGTIGIEVPNRHKETVSMRSQLASEQFVNAKMDLPICLGKTISSENYVTDLAKMPHLLMAGATGQGKSVGVNAILCSLLYKKHPSQLKFVLVDPKKVELSLYKLIEKHFLAKLPGEEDPIITDTKKVVATLNALCMEMDERYDLLKEAHVRNIREYNAKFVKRKLNPEKGHRFLPYIVLVIDEFADLIMTAGKEVEGPIARLAQLARAIGIHLIIATQRPSVNIITGIIKANFPARVAFKVTSKVDSRTILDAGGADQLIGRGDMLLSIGGNVIRLQCPFVDTPEVDNVVQFISEQRGYADAFMLPEYVDPKEAAARGDFSAMERDDLFNDAAYVVVRSQMGSTSMIQRKLKLGYNRAGRLMDQLEAAGIVGQHEGSKAREVLIKTEAELEQFLQNLG